MLIKHFDDYKKLKEDRKYLLKGIEEAIESLKKAKEIEDLGFAERIYIGNALGTLEGIKRGAEEYGYKE